MAEIEVPETETEFLKGFWARLQPGAVHLAEYQIASRAEAWVEGFLVAGKATPDRTPTSFLTLRGEEDYADAFAA